MFKKQQFVLLMSLLLVTLFISNVFAQKRDPRKWNTDVRLSQVFFDDSKIEMIPSTHLNYVHPNTLTSIYDLKNVKAFVYPNFRVHPSNNSQSEVPITRHPTNGNIMFGSSNAVKFSPSLFISEGMYLTTDGGVTWFGSDTTNAAPINNHGGDPAPAIGPEGNLYNSNLGYSTDGIFATVSTNMGATWSSEFTIISGSQDKNHTFVNDIPSSPYYGRVYVTWSRFTATNPPISIAYSTNGGQTYNAWQDVHTVASGHYAQGVNGSVGPNGEVYLAWQSPIAGSPYTGDFVGFAKSTDGGATYTYNNIAYQTNGIRGTLSNKGGIRVNDFPWMGVDKTNGPKRGNIYIVTAEKNLAPAGSDPDIVFHRSTDGGTTWSAGIRVNQDALNNGKDQYMPACVVDDKGAVYVVYYDSRNTSSDSAEVYVSRSMDGGDTWEDVKVSDHRFKPYPISGLAGGYQGDYIGITHSNGSVFPYWADNSTGIYQAWSTKVSFGPVITHNSLPNTENLAGPYPVNASINSASPLSSVKIFWKRGSGSLDSTTMTLDGTTWTGNIPGNGTAATYQYYIYAKDENGNFGSAPGVPGTFFSFDAMPDNVAPIITHTTLPNQYRETWPPVLSALATDNIGIDSIWVTYKLNTNGVERNFALNVNSDGYSNTFNCDTTIISLGDTLYYRIKAKDSGAAHNIGYHPSATTWNSFVFVPDLVAPTLTHSPLNNQARVRWPSLVKANVGDNLGVRSVTVDYKVNNGVLTGTFPLTLTTGSIYAANFPLDTNQVQVGDTIEYRIRAIDISTSYNVTMVPETGYYKFAIINTKGLVLVINDDVTLKDRYSPEKQGEEDLKSPLGASSTLFKNSLFEDGYTVDEVQFTTFDVSTLSNYDIVVLSAGSKTTLMFDDQAKRTAILNFTAGGGKTIVEGGEVGWKYRSTTGEPDVNFRTQLLHCSTWSSDQPGNVKVLDLAHPIFADLPVLLNITGTGYGHRDAMLTLTDPGVSKLSAWDNTLYNANHGSVVSYFPTGATVPRNIYFAFCISSFVDQTQAKKLILNTAEFMMTGAVPVELTSLTANASGNKVSLNWSTATESNNKGFTVERKSAAGFESVGFVAGNGSTTEASIYSFVDNNVPEGSYSYRLKQVDFDGTFSYSQVVNVEVLPPAIYSLEQNYPNPFNPSTLIKFSIPVDGMVTLNVYNLLGEKVASLINGNLKAGRHEVKFDASDLSSGLYFYRIESNNFTSIKKMMLLK